LATLSFYAATTARVRAHLATSDHARNSV